MDILKFRKVVDSIRDPDASFVVKLAYLTGARANELCHRGFPSHEVLRPRTGNVKRVKEGRAPLPLHPRTRAVGPMKSDVSYDVYETPNDNFAKDLGRIQVLKIRMVVLKRKAKNMFILTKAIPLDDRFEPWGVGVNDHISTLSEDAPLVPMHSVALNKLYHEYGFYEMVKAETLEEQVDNPLRHIRYTHLVDYYGFDPWQAPLFMGHKLETAMSGSGGPADAYAALAWRRYFPALLKPLPRPISIIA